MVYLSLLIVVSFRKFYLEYQNKDLAGFFYKIFKNVYSTEVFIFIDNYGILILKIKSLYNMENFLDHVKVCYTNGISLYSLSDLQMDYFISTRKSIFTYF